MDCLNCGQRYDPSRTGWKCPWCGWKDHCCDGGGPAVAKAGDANSEVKAGKPVL